MKQIFTFLFLFSLTFLIYSCQPEKRENFSLGNSYLYYNKIKLTEDGKKKALAVWDSIHPLLDLQDSTSNGIIYSKKFSDFEKSPVCAMLSFEVDTSYFVKPSSLKLLMFIKKPLPNPKGYIYVGDGMILPNGHTDEGDQFTIYEDTLSSMVEHALDRLVQRKGMRFDTDKGPTVTITETQAKNLKLVRSAYEALAIYSNDLNGANRDSLKRKVIPLKSNLD